MTLGEGFTSTTLEDQLEIYDAAVADWMKVHSKHAEKEVPVIVETPERAHSTMAEMFKEFSPENASKRQRSIPLPVISIHRQDITYAPERFMSGTEMFHNLGYIDSNKSAVFQSKAPWPVQIGYQIDFWSRKVSSANFWSLWVSQLFQHQLGYLTIDLRPVWYGWGTKLIPVRYESMADASDLTPGERDRVVRKTFSCSVEGWIFGSMSTLKTALLLESDFRDASAQGDLSAVTADEANDLIQLEKWNTDEGGTTVT